MAFKDWLKEYRETQGSQPTTSKTSSAESSSSGNTKKSTSGSTGSGSSGSSFRDTLKEYREAQAGKSLKGWAETSLNLIKDVQNYSSNWYDDDEQKHRSDRFTSLLAQADNWRKQYSSSSDAVSYINSVVDALSEAKTYSYNTREYYSQWDTAEDFGKYQKEQKAYEDMASFDIEAGQKEITALEKKKAELERHSRTPATNYLTGESSMGSTPYAAGLQGGYTGGTEISELSALISQKKAYLNQAKHIQEGITLAAAAGNADFEEYSGYVSTKSDNLWDKLLGKEYDTTYEYVNNRDGFRDEYKRKHIAYSSDNPWSDGESTFEEKGYDYITEDEVAIYNYYYAKDGKETAEKYLDSIQESLSLRKATGMYENMEEKTLLELAFGVAAGLDQFESGMKNLFNTEDDYIPQTATQMASGMVREDLADAGAKLPDWMGGASLGQMGYDAITTTANMAPSILTSVWVGMVNPVAGEIVGTSLMGASASGNAYQEALNLGYDKDQARGYANMVGASEAVLGYLLGGVSKLGGKLSNKAITSFLNNVDNALLRTAGQLGGKMISEFSEEYLQEVLTPVFSNLMLGTDEEIRLFSAEALYSGLLGALTAGVLEGGGVVKGEVNAYTQGKALKAADITAERLAELGKTFSADTVAYQLAGRVNENTGAYTMGRLFNEIGATLSEQNVTEITEALVAKGMDKATARKNANALAYVVEGGQLTDRQVAVIEANDILAEVARTTLIDANTTWNQRSKGYNEMLKSLADEMTSPKASRTNPAQQSQENAPASNTVDAQKENGVESLSEADTVDTSPAKVKSFSTIEKGRATIKLEDNSEVDVKKADLSPEDGVRIETIASIDGISVEDANSVLDTLRTSTNASAQMDALGAKEVFKYGFYGFSQDHIAKHGVFANSLTESQRQAIYDAGKKARQKQIEQAAPKKAKSATTGIYFDAGNGNVVPYSESNMTALDKKQSAGVQTAMILRKLGIGGDIYFFKSYINAQGRRVYKDKNGKEVKAPNGWYSPGDGSIHIDLNAGNKGDGYVLYTLAHELTHFIEEWSAAKYKILADFLIENYEKGQSMDKLVRAKQAKLSAQRGKPVPYKEAYSEVIADSMEAMLADGNVLEKLIELRAKDNDIFMKMKQFFDNLLTKIRNAYKGLTPDSNEGKAVLEMTDSIEKLQQLFAEALVDASENYQSSEQVLAQAGISVNAETDSGSLLSVRDVLSEVDRNKVAKALADRFNVTEKEAKEWLKAETSLASLILNPKYSMFLDYEADPNEVAIKQNSDYPQGTVDFSNICKKRREFTQVMNRILRNFQNHVFAATDLAKIRTIMGEEGMTLPCGICYVEDRRQLDSIVAQDFINGLKLYREGSKTRPDGKPFNANQLKGLKLTDGDYYVPTIYELVTLEGRNSLKAKNPNMEAAWVKYNNARGMQSVRLLTNEAEYKRQILKYNKNTVKSKNDKGGLRIYSFSDMEMFHLIDIIQVITDSATVGLSIQGYTKVNEYAKAVKDTGLKLNRSLIPKGDLGYHMENGKIVLDYDPVEGIDIHSDDFFDSTDNPNVGNITIGINDTQIRAAMVSDFVDYIIPFHTGQSEEVLGEKGIAAWDNYKDFQTEKDLATGTTAEHQINIYTEVFQAAEAEGKPIQNKRQFVEKFLAVCKENGLKPRFAQFLNTDANGDYIYTEGYHKFLVDFKTFAQTEVGEYLPQMPVKPIFDNAYMTSLLEAYVEEQQVKDAEVAKQMPKVIERITNEIIKPDMAAAESNENSPAYTGEYPNGVQFQHREDDPAKLKFLNDQVERGEYTTVYKALLRIGDTYYPPMASLEKDENGKYTKLRGGQKLFDWIASDGKLTEEMKAKMNMKSPKAWLNKYADAFKNGLNPWGMYGDFKLKKADESGKSQGDVPAAYNPYQHSSDQVLNDQFDAAYDRPGLVVVECRIPNSELTDPYWAPYAKDPTGMHEWKTGPIAGQLKKTTRHVYMTRWIQPIRELSHREVAERIRDIVAKEDTPPRVYWNNINPKVLQELINLGVEIDPYGSPNYLTGKNAVDMYGNPITDEIRAARKAEKEAREAAKKSKKKASNQTVSYSDRENGNIPLAGQETVKYSNTRFFPGNVFPSGLTHTSVAEWANRKDVKTGDKRLVLHRGAYYRVEKFDDMDFGYLITKKYDAKDYEEDLREYGEIDSRKSYESEFDERLARYRETAGHGQRGYYADPSRTGYGGEDRSVYGVGSVQDGQWRTSGEAQRDRQGGLRDQRQTGRENLEWTPQELYDKMQDLDRKLINATGRYATMLKNQREHYASMIDEMNGWDSVKLSDRDNVPTFYSLMAKVVDGVKQEKLGAASVVSMLRGKGVKAEEIKWSGIEEWLAGKKSVTKAELQEFIAGSMLQIEEETLSDQEIPYSQEHQDLIAKYEAERDTIVENLKSEWKRIVGTDIPITYFGSGLDSAVVGKLLSANSAMKGETEAGYKYKAAKAALQRCIEYNDDYFGYDNARQAFMVAVRDPKDFMKAYEMTSFEEGVFRDFIKAKEAYSKVEGIPMQDQKALKAIAESAERFNRRILQVKSEHRAKAAKHFTKWGQYKIRGGSNYRELLFKIPGSAYYNDAMDTHWDGKDGVLAHARIQDLNTFLGKMLFIEEIQSDWHNDGHKDGYASEEQAVRQRVNDLAKQLDELLDESMTASPTRAYAIGEKMDAIQTDKERIEAKLRDGRLAPDAPFRDTYHEYVLKRLLRMAAEQDYDSIGWTTAQIQIDRWSKKFAEGYRIEYDQDIPKFLNKYGKKWGTRVGKTTLDNGTEVWSMAITDEMKESVLTEGQPLYSDRDFPANAEDVAKEYFGTTRKWSETGWLLRDGTQLDFSGRHWERDPENEIDLGEAYYSGKRNMEHYEIAEAFPELRELSHMEYRGEHLDRFMNRGNIRIVGKGIVAIEKMPTEEQFEKLRSYFRENIDRGIVVGIGRGGVDFNAGTNPSIIIEGIRDYFSHNRRSQSDLMRFHTLYQDRDIDSVSNRSLLANALEGVAQNDIERNKIQEYKGKIDLINAEERKLSELNEKIKDLSFSKGPKDTKAIRDLQFEARQTANRINTYDKQLLRLEASKPLQDVLTREKRQAYKRAEQKGKEALAAYRERATKTQRELMDKWQESRKRGIESREKTAMRHKIQSVVGELNQLLLSNDKKRHVPENLKKAVADALALVNMDTVGAEERAAKYAALIAKETDPDKIDAYTATMENILRQGEKMGQRLKDLRDAYEEIQESDDPDIANAYDPVIAGCLKELSQSIGNTSLRDMTIEQLSDVYDMYRMVLTRVRDANKSFLNEKKEAISNLASRVVGEVRRVGGEHKMRLAMLDPVRKFLWNNLKPVYAFEHMGSDTLTEAFNTVRKGEDVWAKDVTEAREYYLDKSKKYGYDSWDFKKKYRFESTSGQEFDLTLEQILSLYAYSKREQAHDHLRLGGFVFDSNIETYKEKDSKTGKSILKYMVNTADAHQISTDNLAHIISQLSSEQMAFVDEMQEYLSTVMGAKGNEVTMKMYGVKLFKEKFYFPLKSARQFMFEQNEVSGEVRIKNSGFTNKVVAKANNPVILSNFMDVWSGHVNDMSMYHSFVLPLEDFNRIFNYNSPKKEGQPPVSVKGTIQSAYSPAAVSYVKQLITDLNGGARSDPAAGFINKMMGLFKKGSVFASLSVVVQQPSAIARAAALVDTKYFIGPKVDHKRHKALWDEVKKYAPVAIIKEMGYFDTNMGKSTQDFIQGKEYSGFKEKMKALVVDSNYRDEILSKAPALADEIAWCSIWEAVKRETKAQYPGLDAKSEPFLMLAGSRFTEVISKTQVYDSILSRSANMRSKDTGMKMATAFMAEPTTSINMIADALLQGKRGNWKYAIAASGAVIASQLLNSILVSFVYAGRDDDEDETYAEKYIGTVTGEFLDSLNPAGYIPFIKDIQSIVQGYDVERSDMAVISDLWNAWQNLSKDNVSVYRKVEGFAGSIAQIFGLPVKNIMRDVRGIYQTIDSFVNGQQTTGAGIGYAVKGAITGKTASDQQQLYEAYLSGDKEHITRVSSRYKDQNAAHSALRKALRENDPRIREAAIAWNANDLDEYMRIAKQIIGEKHFTQDDVVMAIRAEASALAPDTGSSGSSKAKGLFTAEKFVSAIAQGDEATANAAKLDIIQTAQTNGKTEEEAEKSFVSSVKSEMKEQFLEGTLTEDQAIDTLIDYCGETQEDAEEYVGQWAFQQEYGFSWSDRADAYKSGQISAAELQDILVNTGGKTEEEAMWQVKIYDWQNEGFDIDSNQKSVVEDYETFCEPAGIDKHTYFNAYLFYADSGEEGVAYSKTIECMPYIDSLPLSSYQKTALAKCWWAESTVNKYKTW